MKYITRGINNELFFKLNSTPVNTYSGDYLFTCKHIQTSNVVQLTLTDQSITPNVYQKFIITSGQTLSFESGQYELQIYDVTASTVQITEEYLTVYAGQQQQPIIFMSSGSTPFIYGSTGSTVIPDVPQQFNGILLSDGISTQLTWSMGIPNAQGFELWRKIDTGGTYISLGNLQSYIYIDKFLSYSTDYYYKIRAWNQVGYSAFTPEIQIQTTSHSGSTGQTSIHIYGSGSTIVTNPSGNTFIVYTPPTDLSNYVTIPVFSAYTGTTNTTINNMQQEIQALSASTSGGTIYVGQSPAAIQVGGIQVGDPLTGKTFSKLFEELLVPVLYPTFVNPSNSLFTILTPYYLIGTSLSFNTTAIFNRGSISPAYGTNGYRSGLPNTYHYTGTGLPSTISSTALSDNQLINSYTIIQGNQSWTSSVSYDQGQQPKDSKGNNYNSPLAAGTTGVQTASTEGVYPIYATTITINTLTQQALASMINGNSLVYSVVAETGGNKQSFALPNAWTTARPLQGIQTYNTVSNAWEYQGGSQATSKTYWTTSSITEVIQGNTINYTKYTYNGVDRSSVQIKLLF